MRPTTSISSMPAEGLIEAGKAYVDDQSPDEMRANRGTLTEPEE